MPRHIMELSSLAFLLGEGQSDVVARYSVKDYVQSKLFGVGIRIYPRTINLIFALGETGE